MKKKLFKPVFKIGFYEIKLTNNVVGNGLEPDLLFGLDIALGDLEIQHASLPLQFDY